MKIRNRYVIDDTSSSLSFRKERRIVGYTCIYIDTYSLVKCKYDCKGLIFEDGNLSSFCIHDEGFELFENRDPLIVLISTLFLIGCCDVRNLKHSTRD